MSALNNRSACPGYSQGISISDFESGIVKI